MPESKSHKTVAKRLAKKFNTEYNSGKGPDVIANDVVIEVETEATVHDAKRQLKGYNSKKVYVAVTTKAGAEKALKEMEGTTIGVMDSQGNILKESSRGRKKS